MKHNVEMKTIVVNVSAAATPACRYFPSKSKIDSWRLHVFKTKREKSFLLRCITLSQVIMQTCAKYNLAYMRNYDTKYDTKHVTVILQETETER